jgi:hypothetical protein
MKNGTEMHSRNLEGGTGTEHLQVLGSWASEHHLTPRRRGPCHSENAAKFISGTWHQYIRKFEVGVLLGPKPFGLSLLIRSRPRLSPLGHYGNPEDHPSIFICAIISYTRFGRSTLLTRARACFDFSHVAHFAMLKDQPSGIN